MRGFYADSVLLVVHCCKTLKTHSVAAELGLRILLTFYSWVSSTSLFLSDGPKSVKNVPLACAGTTSRYQFSSIISFRSNGMFF